MKGIAAFMVLSLLTRSHTMSDDRQYDYPRPTVHHPGHRAEAHGYPYPSQPRVSRPTQ